MIIYSGVNRLESELKEVPFLSFNLGGRMVLVQFAVDDEGQFTGQTRKAAASLHGTLRDLWRELRDEGLVTKVTHFLLLVVVTALDRLEMQIAYEGVKDILHA